MQNRTRWENIKYYGWKGMIYFSPCSFIGPAASLGIYYGFQYDWYNRHQTRDLAHANDCDWTWSQGVLCPLDPDRSNRLNAEAEDYATQHARADLLLYSSPLVIPWMFTGMALGVIYGACQPVRQSIQMQSPNEIIIDDDPPEYIDPVSLEIMIDPQKLECGHDLEMATITALEKHGNEACKCPLCRAPIKTYKPDDGLKKEIDNYISTNARGSKLGFFSKKNRPPSEDKVSLLPESPPTISMNNNLN